MSTMELILSYPDTLKVAHALSSGTCARILQLISKKKLDVSTIAKCLKLSEPYISKEIHLLEDLKLIKISRDAF